MSVFTLEKNNTVAVISMNDTSVAQNVLNQDIQDDFERVFKEVESDNTLTGLIFQSTKPKCFLAGADISMLQNIKTQDQARDASYLLHAMTKRIADLPVTTVAAINGICLGGGLELALAFDYRIATDDKSTKLGVPEVQLGILPGGGGTQRIPRLIDLPTALDLILTGKQLNATRSKKAGLVDTVVHPDALMDVALKYVAKGRPRRSQSIKDKLMSNQLVRGFIISQARKKTLKLTKGKYPAPIKILDVIEQGMNTDLTSALKIEADGFAELLMTSESSQLVNIFFATTELKKDTGVDSDARARDVKKVSVLGAGLMGAGIAYVSIDKAGKTVRLKDISVAGVAKGVKYIGNIIDKKLKRRYIKPHHRDELMSRLTSGIDYRGIENTDVVIEAVFESLELKQKIVADIESLNPAKEIIFATNTSAIPIDEVAAQAKFPERVVGMHYFSPVEKMPLLEVISGSKTADYVTATAVELGKQQGKTVIVVNDGPGFYTTRILVPYGLEAVRLILEGVSIEAIDQALEEFGMPIGPIKLLDEVGIDVGAHIVTTLNDAFGERIPLLDDVNSVVDDGRKGKKNKRGFYDYSAESKGKKVDESIYSVLGVNNPASKYMSPQSIAQRIILVMLNEAAFCLSDKVLRSARDGDIGAIFGLGFPPFLGGPFRYMDSLGIKSVIEKLGALEKTHGQRFQAAPALLELAKKDKTFYS